MPETGGSTIISVAHLWVPGVAKPQGSKRAYVHKSTGKAVIVEDNKKMRDWRADVKIFAELEMLHKTMVVAPSGVSLEIVFVMPRPLSTPKTRPTPLAVKKPDLDKLVRGVLDALTGIVYTDDSQVISMHVTKRIAEIGEQPGAFITVNRVEI